MGIDSYYTLPASNNLHADFVGGGSERSLYASQGKFMLEQVDERSQFTREELEALADVISQAWDKVNIPNLPSFEEILAQASWVRKASGNPVPLTLFTAIQESVIGILNRIITAREADGLSAEYYRYSATVPAVLTNALGKAVLSGDIREDFYTEEGIRLGEVDLEDIREIVYQFFGQRRSLEDHSEQDWARFVEALPTLLSQEWILCIFVEYLQYRSAPMSPVTSQTMEMISGEDFTPELCKENYAAAAALAELVKPGDQVLDLGTGTGVSARLLAKAVEDIEVNVYAVDRHDLSQQNGFADWANDLGIEDQRLVTRSRNHYKHEFYEHVQRIQPNLLFLNAGAVGVKRERSNARLKPEDFAGTLPFAEGTFKVVVLGYVARHLASEVGEAFTKEVMRVLADDGVILVEEGEMGQYKVYKSVDSPWLKDWLGQTTQLTEEQARQALSDLLSAGRESTWHMYSGLSDRDREVFTSRFSSLTGHVGYKESDVYRKESSYWTFRRHLELVLRLAESGQIKRTALYEIDDIEKFRDFAPDLGEELLAKAVRALVELSANYPELSTKAESVLMSYSLSQISGADLTRSEFFDYARQIALSASRMHVHYLTKLIEQCTRENNEGLGELLTRFKTYVSFGELLKSMREHEPSIRSYVPRPVKDFSLDTLEMIAAEDKQELLTIIQKHLEIPGISEEYSEVLEGIRAGLSPL